MAIQWFPGHMHKAKKALMRSIKETDVVIELLDARLPFSSINPLLKTIAAQKPLLKILNKEDLADPCYTSLWLDYFRSNSQGLVVPLNAKQLPTAKWLMTLCRQLAPHRGQPDKPMRGMVWGVPNVGKSTFINAVKRHSIAKTGNEAGITKQENLIVIADDFWLIDTPGMLWPKIEAEASGMNLATSGALGKNAFDAIEVAYYLLDYLRLNYPQALLTRYDMPSDSLDFSASALLEAIAKNCGALLAGGKINYQQAANRLLTDFRSGAIGRITLEIPPQRVD